MNVFRLKSYASVREEQSANAGETAVWQRAAATLRTNAPIQQKQAKIITINPCDARKKKIPNQQQGNATETADNAMSAKQGENCCKAVKQNE
ncbi:unnamed protein product [Ceratitis capitata]|uniref:(Mediterranean fruit fly) hypothetical protein n=1 Tax=Ceratitis capitata TaxID=7213 RepID=A0A811V3S6_CERCA|nr:unnamed protein product [Ceratitis capitata]